MIRVGILTWDWREQPSIEDLQRIVDRMPGVHLHISDVDTGSDQIAWAFSTEPLSPYGLDLAWRQHWDESSNVFDLPEER